MRLRRITYHVPCGSEASELVQAGDWLMHEHRRTGALAFFEVMEAREGRKGRCERHGDERGPVCCRRWGLFVQKRMQHRAVPVDAGDEFAHLLALLPIAPGGRLLALVWDAR